MTFSWGYKSAFVRCALLFAVGTALQIAFGDIDNSFLRYPWGLIIAINYIYLLLLIYSQSAKWPWLKTLYDGYACVSSLASMMLMTIIFGFTRQDAATEGLVGLLGFSRMTSSWSFNFILLYFTTTTGLALMDDLHHLRQRRWAAVMSHLAVFVVLAAGIFGSGDKLRVTIRTQVDQPVYAGMDRNGRSVELPFAITLKEFSMEEYPPKLYILNTVTETSSEEFLSVEREGDEAIIDGWRIRVVQSLDMAARLSDEEHWQAMQHVGAAPAVYVVVRHERSGQEYEGWVSCGSFVFEPSYLMMGRNFAVAMPRREAKSYLSRIELMDEAGQVEAHDIRVNHPARKGSWQIYQVGYDTSRGRWSTTSVLECVRDGWWSVIHTALWLLIAMGVVMFLTAGRRAKQRKEGNDELG